jgi:ABC-2 type transport system ATP-binding protein
MSYVEEFCAHICIINNGEIVLNGKIKDIKKTYPRNRLLITKDKNTDIVKCNRFHDMVASYSENSETMEVTLKNEKDKQGLLQLITAASSIEGFSVIEPSLQDIFVEYAREVVP